MSQQAAGREDQMRFGPYVATHPLAIGHDAAVWHADGDNGPVAIKVPRNAEAVRPLRAEYDLLIKHKHPHLPVPERADLKGAWFAYVQIQGEPLHTWAQGRSVHSITDVVLEIADTLRFLHRQDVFHGDVKPSHVLVDGWGHARLIDLGCAAAPNTRLRRLVTPGFAAPELLAGQQPTAASDVYSLGATAYAAISQRPPFDVRDPAALIHLAHHGLPIPCSSWPRSSQKFKPTDPPARPHQVPEGLDELLAGMLRATPTDRPSLDLVVERLSDLWRAPPRTPASGMEETRRALYQAVSQAMTRPTAVVLVGPPASGVSLLLEEAEQSAMALGFSHGKGGGPPVRRASWPTAGLAEKVISTLHAQAPGLWLIESELPIAALDVAGVHQVLIEPLRFEATRGALEDLSPADAMESWRAVGGHPGRLGRQPLTPTAHPWREIIEALERQHGSVTIGGLARTLSLHPMALIDRLELLEAEGAVSFGSGGQTVRLADTWLG